MPGFKQLTDREAASIMLKPGSLTPTDDCVVILDDVHSKLQPFIEQVMILGKY